VGIFSQLMRHPGGRLKLCNADHISRLLKEAICKFSLSPNVVCYWE